jgi:phosphoglycerate dehydrogenase-like enzyme
MYTIKTLNAISPVGLAKLNNKQFDVAVDTDAPDGILVRSADMLNTAFNDNLLAIARAGAGVNNIPLERCSEQGIVVFNTPGANANAVAELVIGMLIAGSRNVAAAAQWCQGLTGDPAMAKTVEKGKKQFVGNEIKGKTLGVIGLGAIGSRVANCAIELGMEVYGYDPYISIDAAWNLSSQVHHCVNLNDMLPLCDYITIHVPYLPTTKDTINAQTLALCKDGVKILNYARGELVNTAALLEGHTCKLVTYGRDEKADYRETGYKLLRTHDFLGVAFHVTGKDEMDVKVNMPGEFSVYNALAALAVGKVLGLPDQAIHDGLGKCVVKGRVELVPISKKFTILLDYAHNEVSTESLLTTLRAYKPHRLVVVFGCGGNRSKLRRYGMGEICAKMADFSILTEDNNRFEKVEDILADIRVGMNKGNPEAKFVEIPDRLDALHYAVDHAQEGDLIAVIGKGHETYRDREGVKTPFLERELLEEYAQQKGLE